MNNPSKRWQKLRRYVDYSKVFYIKLKHYNSYKIVRNQNAAKTIGDIKTLFVEVVKSRYPSSR